MGRINNAQKTANGRALILQAEKGWCIMYKPFVSVVRKKQSLPLFPSVCRSVVQVIKKTFCMTLIVSLTINLQAEGSGLFNVPGIFKTKFFH